MPDPGPSKSRILAALDLTEDDQSPSLPPQTQTQIPGWQHLLSSRPGGHGAPSEKRKRGAEYISALAAPLNKRQAYTPSTSRSAPTNRLPAGLLESTQSPGAHIRGVLLYVV